MSTAKKVLQETPELTPADFADILSTTLALAQEIGANVRLGNRADGLLILVSGLEVNEAGQIVVKETVDV